MMMMMMMMMMLMMRRCEGAAAWRDAQVMWREFTWGRAWKWTFRAERRCLDPKREHPTMSMVAHHLVHLNSHLGVYIVRHTHRAGKKNTISVSTNSNVSFCGTYGCSNLSLSSHRWVLGKWMSKNDEKSEFQVEWWWWWGGGWWWWCWWWWWWWRDTAKGLLREETHKECDESSLGGGWNWTFREERRYLDPKREHPTMSMVAHHLVHWNSHLEVYIVRHTHRAGEKKHDQC